MPRPFRSDRHWTFDLGPDDLWARLSSCDDYQDWWPWLRGLDRDGGFRQGARWHCEVAPPLPYVVRFTVELLEVEPPRRVAASVVGDVVGEAELRVEPVGVQRSRAWLGSRLAPAHPLLRAFGAIARPAVEWGHDWVLDQGRRQFVARIGRPAGRSTRRI